MNMPVLKKVLAAALSLSLSAGLSVTALSAKTIQEKAHARVILKDGKYYGYTKYDRKMKGWNVIGNRLYYFNGKNNAAVTNRTVRHVHLLSNGVAADTLDAELTKKVTTILKNRGALNASRSRKLRVLWNYLTSRAHFGYYSRYPNLRSSSWAKDYALWMLNNHHGNCYGFACTFAAMAYVVGYSPVIVTGRVHGHRDHARDGYTRHACVRINKRWYDPEGQCAGWLRGVYGTRYYRTSFISKTYHRYASQNGNKLQITVSKNGNRGKYYYYRANGFYYGFDNKNHPLTGFYYINNKLFRFSKGHHRMPVSEQKKLQKKIGYKSAFKNISKVFGKAKKKKNNGEGCSGIDGDEMIYSYDHLNVNTVKPADGSHEIILSVVGK